MPTENGVWGDEGRDFPQHAPSESLPEHGETTALVIVQPQPSGAQLRFQCPVLFTEEGDHIALFVLEPAKQRRQ